MNTTVEIMSKYAVGKKSKKKKKTNVIGNNEIIHEAFDYCETRV